MKNRALRITILTLAVAAILAGGIYAKRNDFGLGRNMEMMVNMMHLLSTQYVDEVDPDKMMKDGAAGITRHLDPYTSFIPESEMAEFQSQHTGRYGGIGSMIRKKGDYIIINEPYKGSPSDLAGLKAGDKILAVNGQDMKGKDVGDVSKVLRGEPNTSLTITVEKWLTGETIDVKIQRRLISIPSIPYAGYVAEGIGYICHTDFTESCYDSMRAAILRLQKSGELKGLIIDYRGNGGGLLAEAVDILSLFVPKGSMVIESRGRNGESRKYYTRLEPILPNTPVALLIDDHSASAAEIVTGALQDYDRAVLIGQRSFGKGLVQSTLPVGYNSYLKFTSAKFYIPSGRCIQARSYDKDGRSKTIADSLIKEFKTAHGRKVYDGGGITPDLKREAESASEFLIALSYSGVVDDFCDEYWKKNSTQKIDVRGFTISDEDYEIFSKMALEREFEYKSFSRYALEKLRESIKEDKNDSLNEALDAIDKGLKDDKQSSLKRYREEIISYINRDIVTRYAYKEGLVEHSIVHDKWVHEAVRVLSNEAEYKRITTEQDTARK